MAAVCIRGALGRPISMPWHDAATIRMIRTVSTETETEPSRSRTESDQAHTGWCLKLEWEANRLTRSRGFDLGFERLKFEIENRRNLEVHARIGMKQRVV